MPLDPSEGLLEKSCLSKVSKSTILKSDLNKTPRLVIAVNDKVINCAWFIDEVKEILVWRKEIRNFYSKEEWLL